MTQLKKIFSAVFMLCCFTTVFAQVTLEWVNKNAGDSTSGAYSYYNAMAVDNSGNVCVAGEMYTGNGNQVLLAKYSSSGATLWTATYSANNSTYEYVRGGVAVDASNNIYVSGYVYYSNNNYNNYYDLFVVKYDPNGNLLWSKIYDSGYNDYMDFSGIIVESNGAVVIAGSLYNNNNSNNIYDLIFVKYDASGNLLWNTTVDGGYYEYLRSIDADNSGNVFGSFQTYNYNSNGYNTIGLTKLNSSGAQQAYQVYNVNNNTQLYNYANNLDVANNGDVFIAGYIYDPNNSNYYDLITIKYDNSVTQQWVQIFDGGSYDYYGSLAADNTGNVTVTSNSYNANSGTYDWNLVKYDNAGNHLWSVLGLTGNDSTNNYSWNTDITLDNSGNSYSTGYGYNYTYNRYSAKTVKVNADSSFGWLAVYGDSTANNTYSYSLPYDVDVDNQGNVYVSGYDDDPSSYSSGSRMLTLKYSQGIAPEFKATTTKVSCKGSSDGTITLNVTAGNRPPFSYSIDSANTFSASNVFSGLAAGKYYAAVKDSLGKLSVIQKVIVCTKPDTIAPTIVCGGDIKITANSNDCNPIVTWQGPAVSDSCSFTLSSNHISGEHFPVGKTLVTYTATDVSGNISTCSFYVIVCPSPLKGHIVSKNVSCHGSADGSATAYVSGGCMPYTYSWNTSPVQTTATATNLAAGTYTVTVTDANGQIITLTVTITQPAALVVSAGANTTVYYGYPPLACANLVSSVSGGTAPYTYLWSNGATTSTINVCPTLTTTYTLWVTDANGCKGMSKVTVCVVDVRDPKCVKSENDHDRDDKKDKDKDHDDDHDKDKEGKHGSYKGKILICHKSGNNKFQTLSIDADAVAAHLAHGDKLGACGTKPCQAGKTDDELIAAELPVSSDFSAFPNPFSNTTTLVFTGNGSERTTVEILDLKGALMQTAFDGNTVDGQVYRIDVDGLSWSDAIYIARVISTNDHVQNIKLVLTK